MATQTADDVLRALERRFSPGDEVVVVRLRMDAIVPSALVGDVVVVVVGGSGTDLSGGVVCEGSGCIRSYLFADEIQHVAREDSE